MDLKQKCVDFKYNQLISIYLTITQVKYTVSMWSKNIQNRPLSKKTQSFLISLAVWKIPF